MYKSILKTLLKWFEKLNKNSEAGIINIRHQLYFMDFEERECDIFVVTYLKSGTTWMQVILHNLLTDGNMDFNHIYDVSPWPKNQSYKNESVNKINALPAMDYQAVFFYKKDNLSVNFYLNCPKINKN